MTDHNSEDLEEQLTPRDSKEWRKERKRARAADRSQFKKSDQDQQAKQAEAASPELSGYLLGRVLSVTAQGYEVDCKGTRYACVLRRTLLQQTRRVKNLITVGDLVYFETTHADEGVIAAIRERYSLLARSDSLQARRQHLIAANIDQVLITGSVSEPTLKPALIDRYIIAARKGQMEPVIVINKVDLSPRGELASFVELYSALGFTVLPVSANTGQGLAALKQAMQSKASVFAGQSGVGKSSLINAVTGLALPTGKVVAKTGKGGHTTTRARLLPLADGGWCIDTPGIKSFGLWELSKGEIASFFSEIEAARQGCHFPDCSHMHEPDCAVIQAVEQGKISPLRYESYLTLLKEVQSQRHRRR